MSSQYVPSTQVRVATAVFDPGVNVDQRTIAVHECAGDVIPYGANILRIWYKTQESVTSGGAATLGFGLTGWTGALKSAIALADLAVARNQIPSAPANVLTSPVLGGSHITATPAGFALTAGRLYIMVEYSITA